MPTALVSSFLLLALFTGLGCTEEKDKTGGTTPSTSADQDKKDASADGQAAVDYLTPISEKWETLRQEKGLTDKLADINLRDWNEQQKKISELAGGKPTVLVFVGPSCPYSKKYMDMLKSKMDDLEKDLAFVFVALGPADEAKFYLEKIKYPWSFLVDPQEIYAAQYGYVGEVPYSVFLTSDGTILGVLAGYVAENEQAFLRLFEQLAAYPETD